MSKKLKIYDIIWGNTEIDDFDIRKIIKHPSMQRIKKIWISTYGYLFNLLRNSTRYDHSIGVYLLLKKFKASKEEQVAGLIHDVSHTAFSHLSTYAMLGKFDGVEFHEMVHERIIKESGLEDLISKIGFNPENILHNKKHTMLENNLPDICADRLDYTIRDGLHLQILSRQQVEKILQGLTVKNHEFVFKNKESAFIYSFTFYVLNLMFYGSPSEAHFNNDFGNLVKYAVKSGVLNEKDWFTDDVFVVNKLNNTKNTKIIKWMNKYNNNMVVYEDTKNPDVIFPTKIRIVNPKILDGTKFKRLSKVDPVYKKLISDYQKSHKDHNIPVRVEYKNIKENKINGSMDSR